MAHLHARGLGATRETAMGEPYAPAPLIRLLGCMELTVHLATYSGHDATSKLQTLTSQCHYALTFHEECRASMHAHDDWYIFEADRAYERTMNQWRTMTMIGMTALASTATSAGTMTTIHGRADGLTMRGTASFLTLTTVPRHPRALSRAVREGTSARRCL